MKALRILGFLSMAFLISLKGSGQPLWIPATPSAGTPGALTIPVNYGIDRIGTVYIIVDNFDNTTVYTSAEVKAAAIAGPSGSRVATVVRPVIAGDVNKVLQEIISVADAGTFHTINLVAEDVNPVLQAAPVRLTTTTLTCSPINILYNFLQPVVCINKGVTSTYDLVADPNPQISGIYKGTQWTLSWGDGTISNYTSVSDNDLPPVGIRTHTYSTPTNCNYIFQSSITNPCGQTFVHEYVAVVHGRDIPSDGDGLLRIVDNSNGNPMIQVCEGTQSVITIRDNSIWNCQNPVVPGSLTPVPNNDPRNIEWLYGRDPIGVITNTITGAVNITTLGVAPVSSGRISAPNSVTLSQAITIPATAKAGEYFRVYLKNWNKCNWADPEYVFTYIDIQVIASPPPPVAPNKTICFGDNRTLTVTSVPVGTITWFADASLTIPVFTGTTYTPANPAIGTYNFWVTDRSNVGELCMSPATMVNLTILPVIATNNIAPAQTICYNTVPALLTGTLPVGGNGTYTYLWESSTLSATGPWVAASGVNSNKDYIPVVSLTQTTWFRRIVNSGPCNNISPSLQITINPTPTIITAGTLNPICSNFAPQNTTLFYSATTNSPTSYSIDWNAAANAAGLADQGNTPFPFAAGGGIIPNIVVTANTPGGTYLGTMTIVNANGCAKTQAVVLTINPLPTITTPGTLNPICFSPAPQITTLNYVASTNSPNSYSIDWNMAANAAGLADQGNTPFPFAAGGGIIPNIAVSANTTPGTYLGTLTIMNANGCTKTQPVTLTVNPLLTITTPGTLNAICHSPVPQNASLFYSAATGNPISYMIDWNAAANTAGLADQGITVFPFAPGGGLINNIAISPNTPAGFYTGTMIITSPMGCPNTYPVSILVNPIAELNNKDTIVCSGDTFYNGPENLNSGYAPLGTTYTWPAPAVTGGITGGTAGSGMYIIGTLNNPTNTAQTAIYTITPVSGTCTGPTLTLTVTVEPRPQIVNLTSIICSGTTFFITPVNVTNGIVPANTTYSWPAPVVTGGITGGVPGYDVMNISGTLTNPTDSPQTATYTVTPISGACSGTPFTVVVTVNPLPVTTSITGQTILCENETNKVYQVANNPGSTYTWTVPANLTKTFDAGLYFILVDAISGTPGTGSIMVTETNTISGCSGLTSILNVTVEPPSIPVPITGPVNICQGDVGVVYSVPERPGSVYSWTVPPGAVITSDPASHEVQVSFLSAGVDQISVIETTNASCITIHVPVSVNVNPQPVPTISGPSSATLNSTGNIYSTEAGMTNYNWNVSPGGTITAGGTITDNTCTVTWNASGLQTVSVNYTNQNNCSGLNPTIFNVSVGSPLNGTSVTTNVLCFGSNTGSVTVTGFGGVPPYEYSLNAAPYQVSGTFVSLPAGIWTITVRDASLSTFEIQAVITEPATALTGSITSQTNVSIAGGNDGSVTVAGSGGTAPYLYRLGAGAYQVSGTFGSLSAGSYSATIQDAGLCTFEIPITITQPPQQSAVLTTSAISSITKTTASGGGNITDDGGETITVRGVCWSTSSNPTISDSKTSDGTGTGVFTSSLTGLIPNTKYYIRAYATNSIGTAYGEELQFQTAHSDPAECLVYWYPFNGNADEETGSGADGNVNGAVLTEDRFGNANSSYYFNGTDNSITIPGILPITNVFTISFWAYSERESGYGNILTDGGINYGGNDFLINFRGNAIGIRGDKGGSSLNYEYSGPPEILNLNLVRRWVHVAWVMNPASSIIYLDGVKIAEINIPGTNEGYHDDHVTIGARHVWTNMDYFFLGKLDDIRIYNCDLTEGEIYNIFTEQGSLVPSVITTSIADITGSTATSGGNIISDGGSPVIARGICWSTTANPTLSDNFTTDGTGSGSFTSNITGLVNGTTYYVRAYATSLIGTAYGDEKTFTPNTFANCGTVTDADGNVYNTISFGSQCWMQENLKTTKYKDDSPITLVTDNSTWGSLSTPGYCWYDNDELTNKMSFGALYNWYAVNSGKLCPSGWHVPTDEEWTILQEYLINNGYNFDGTTSDNKIGKAMASASGWAFSNVPGAVGTYDYLSMKNATGFSGLPAGFRRSDNGVFQNKSALTHWWSSSSTGFGNSTSRTAGLLVSNVDLYREYALNGSGFSVRCIQGEGTVLPTMTATSAITSITGNTAASGGNISSDGGSPVTARGVCWSTSVNPTIADNKTSDGTGTGSFTSTLTGLIPGTVYYVRAYATNSVGTAYGYEESFITTTPASTLTGSGDACVGTLSSIRITLTQGTPPYLINYTRNGVYQVPITNYISGSDINLGILPAGTFTFRIDSIRDAGLYKFPAGSLPGAYTITINPVGQVNTPFNQVLFNGYITQVVNFTTTNTGGATTYTWTNNNPSIGLAPSGTGDILPFVALNPSTTPLVATITVTPHYVNGPVICTGPSQSFAITVNSFEPGSIGSDQTICENAVPATLTTITPPAGSGTFTYQWMSSLDGVVYSDIVAATSPTYSPPALNQDTWYKLKVTCTISGNSETKETNLVKITVNNFDPGTIMSDQTICEGSTPITFTSVSPSGDGTISYQWLLSNDGLVFNNIAGAVNEIYSPAALTEDSYFKRNVTSTINGNSCTEESNVVRITVVNFNPGSINANQTICEGGIPAAFTSISPNGDGLITYQWQNSTDGVLYNNIPGGTMEIYSAGSLTQDTYYRRLTTTTLNAVNCTLVSNPVKVTVEALPMPSVSGPASVNLNSTGNVYTTESGMSNYTWNVSPGGMVTSGGTPADNTVTVTWSTTGNQTVSVNYLNSGGCSAVTPAVYNVTVISNPPVSATLTGSGDACTGIQSSIRLVITGGTSPYTLVYEVNGIAQPSINGYVSGTDYNLGILPPGTYLYEITSIGDAAGNFMPQVGLPVTYTFNINPIPNASATINNSPYICNDAPTDIVFHSDVPNTDFIYTVMSVPATIWQPGKAPVSGIQSNGEDVRLAQNLAHTSTQPVTVTYTITPIGPVPTSCTGIAFVTTVIVSPAGQVNQPVNQVVCGGGVVPPIPFTTTNTGVQTYLWTNNNTSIGLAGWGFGATEIPSFTAVNNGTTSVTASITVTPIYISGGSCVGQPKTFTITVLPTPNLSGTLTPPAICSSTTFSYIPASGVAGTTFNWTRPAVAGISNAAASGTGNPNETLVNTTTNPVPVVYTYTLMANGCINTQNVTVIVNPKPLLTSPLTPPPVCSNTMFSYIPASGTAGTIFTWSRAAVPGITPAGPASGTGNPNELLINNTFNPVPVVYTYTLMANGCINTQNVTVIVNPKPVLTSTLTPPAICSNSIFTYTPASATPGTIFNWSRPVVPGITPAGPVSGTGNPNELLTNTTTNPVPVVYAYTLMANGCTNTQNVTVIVNPKPQMTSTLTPPPVCSNTQFSYNPTSATAGTIFTWTRAAVAGISNSAASGTGNPNETLINTTTIPVPVVYTYTLMANGCINIQNFTVIVNPKPVLTSTLTPPAICSNSIFTYTPASATPGTIFNWSRPVVPGITPAVPASGTGNPNELLTNTTTNPVPVIYTYTLIANGCSNTQNVTVTVNPTPALTSTLTPPSICSNAPFSYIPVSGVPGTTFNWTRAAVAGISNSAASGTGNPNETLVNTTTDPVPVVYTYTLMANGCINIQNVTVIVNPRPVLTSTLTPPALCSNTTFSYIPASNTPGTVFTWTRPLVAGITPAGPASGTGNPNEILVNNTTVPQTVTYIYTLNSNGCTNVQNITVMVNPKPDLTTPGSAIVCSGLATNILLTSNIPGASYTWTIGTVTGGITGATSSAGPVISQVLANPGNTPGTVTYIVTPTANSCSGDPENIVITVNPVPDVTMSGNTVICSGSTTDILLESNVTGATFNWTIGPITGGITGASASGGATINQTLVNHGATPGTVTYIVTPVANYCDGNQVNIVVTVNPSTGATTFTTGATAICQDAPDETYTANAVNSTSITYSVTPSAAGIMNTVTGVMNWDGAFNGSATITATSAGLCGSTFANRVVTVGTAPDLVITDPAPVCSPGTADLTASSVTSGSTPGLTYTYWTDAGAAIVYPTPASAPEGTYYIKGTSAPGCYDIKPVVVAVHPKPLANAGGSQTICATETATISGASASNGTIIWKTSGKGVLSDASTLTPAYTSAAADAGTTVTLTMTVTSNNACFPQKDSAMYTIYVNQSQTITFSALPEKTYGDNTFTLSATSSSGLGITYTSSDNSVASVSGNYVTIKGAGNAIIYANQQGNLSVCPAPEVSQPLKVKLKGITVTVNPLQSKNYGSADPVLSYTCNPPLVNGDKFTGSLTRTAGENPGTYTIQQGNLSAGPNYSIASFIPSYFIINKAVLTVSGGTAERHYLEPNPAFTIVCSGFVNGEDKSVLDILPTATTIATSESDAGSYSIVVSGGSDNNYSFKYVNGVLNIQKADQYIIFNDLPDKLRKTQQWQLEAIASSGLPVSFESDDLKKGIIEGSTLIVLKEGHNVIIARQDGNQNWNPATPVSKSYVGQPTFDNVTSMFTPNGDGVNDYWYIPNIEEFGEIQVKVYNRFGKLVYESQYYKNDWDGTFNSAPLPSASYYYVIKSSEKGIINGVVNIVR